jgi:histidine triad (HIT) family protein
MNQCLFCKIIKKEIPSHRIYEDDNVIGILDLFPNTEGQAIVINKKHYPSDFSKMPDDDFKNMMMSAKKLVYILKQKLEVNRIALVVEGIGVDHIHIKLYPMNGLGEDFEALESKQTVYYETYPGFVDTRPGEKADDGDLAIVANRIKN